MIHPAPDHGSGRSPGIRFAKDHSIEQRISPFAKPDRDRLDRLSNAGGTHHHGGALDRGNRSCLGAATGGVIATRGNPEGDLGAGEVSADQKQQEIIKNFHKRRVAR